MANKAKTSHVRLQVRFTDDDFKWDKTIGDAEAVQGAKYQAARKHAMMLAKQQVSGPALQIVRFRTGGTKRLSPYGGSTYRVTLESSNG